MQVLWWCHCSDACAPSAASGQNSRDYSMAHCFLCSVMSSHSPTSLSFEHDQTHGERCVWNVQYRTTILCLCPTQRWPIQSSVCEYAEELCYLLCELFNLHRFLEFSFFDHQGGVSVQTVPWRLSETTASFNRQTAKLITGQTSTQEV